MRCPDFFVSNVAKRQRTTEAAENGITTAPDRKILFLKVRKQLLDIPRPSPSRDSTVSSSSRAPPQAAAAPTAAPEAAVPAAPIETRRRQNVAPLYADMSDAQIETIAEEEEKIAACESIRRAKQRMEIVFNKYGSRALRFSKFFSANKIAKALTRSHVFERAVASVWSPNSTAFRNDMKEALANLDAAL